MLSNTSHLPVSRITPSSDEEARPVPLSSRGVLAPRAMDARIEQERDGQDGAMDMNRLAVGFGLVLASVLTLSACSTEVSAQDAATLEASFTAQDYGDQFGACIGLSSEGNTVPGEKLSALSGVDVDTSMQWLEWKCSDEEFVKWKQDGTDWLFD